MGSSIAQGKTWLASSALALVEDVQDTLDSYHVCKNDAVLQAELILAYRDTGFVTECDAAQDICRGPKWFYVADETP